MNDYAERRRMMVENQLRPSRIVDERVLSAMGETPRELCLPKPLRGVAYGDDDILLGEGRHLIEPLALAKLLQAAAIKPQDVALVIGCTTGYSAAVMARLAATVFLLVPDATASASSEAVLNELGCDNVVVVAGAPAAGHASQAPFDVILLAGSVPEIPRPLLDQLTDGGRLVAVVAQGRAGKVTVATRVGDVIGRQTPADAGVPPLAGLDRAPVFSF